MSLYHRKVAMVLDEVEDLLSSPENQGSLKRMKGKRTGADTKAILEKLEKLKEEFPILKSTLESVREGGKQDEKNEVSYRSKPGAHPPGTLKPGAPLPPRATPEIKVADPSSGEEDLYEEMPGNSNLPEKGTKGKAALPALGDDFDSRGRSPSVNSRSASPYEMEASSPWTETSAAEAGDGALYKGKLQKKKQGLLGSGFKQRFCVLRDGVLIIYDKNSDKKPKEILDLVGYEIRETSADKFSFKLTGMCKSDHEFSADSVDEYRKWLDHMQTMTTAASNPVIPTAASSSGSDSEPDVPSPVTTMQRVPDMGKVKLDLSDPHYTCAFLCKWDFRAAKPQQVNAKAGDILDLLNTDYDSFGWWTVEFKGKVGLIPKLWLTPAFERMMVD